MVKALVFIVGLVGFASWISPKTQASGPCATDPFELKICSGLLLCQVSSHPNQGFSFHHANIHTPHIHTHHDKVIAISASPYYVVGVDNNEQNVKTCLANIGNHRRTIAISCVHCSDAAVLQDVHGMTIFHFSETRVVSFSSTMRVKCVASWTH